MVLEPHIERCAGENDDASLARAFHEKYLAAIFLQDNFTTTPLSALATDTPLFLAKPTHIALVLLRVDRMCLAPRLTSYMYAPNSHADSLADAEAYRSQMAAIASAEAR